MKTLFLISFLMAMTLAAVVQKLQVGSTFPITSVKDIWGKEILLNNGKPNWWLFQRNIGCPGCNLRMHNISKMADSLKAKGIAVIVVLESKPEYIKEFVKQGEGSLLFVADPERKLYDLVAAERSTGKLMKGMFHGAMGMVSAGNKVMGGKRKQDGHVNTIPVEFVVDGSGKVIFAYYSRYLGDDAALPLVASVINK